jgi:hypothetical protein
MAKKSARKKRRVTRPAAAASAISSRAARNFTGSLSGTISRDEIYHRLEWYFDRSHNPHGPHSIPPGTSIGLLLHNLGLQDLYVNINRASQMYVPAWGSMLFNGVIIPWISAPGVAIGVKDVKTLDDLINCLVLSYQHAGWNVLGA